MPYRTLDASKILATLVRLEARISERFPGSGLATVCSELIAVARETQSRITALERPNIVLRSASITLLVGGLALAVNVAGMVEFKRDTENLFGVLQGIEALINIIAVVGAGIFFITTLESRWKRQQALAHLHELRSIVHVIDMHQLTKDPSVAAVETERTKSSPDRTLTPFALTRYLDYCSEMLSLAAKTTALYAQSARDDVIIDVVNDIERLTASMSQKIWQKIMIVQTRTSLDAAAPALSAPHDTPPHLPVSAAAAQPEGQPLSIEPRSERV